MKVHEDEVLFPNGSEGIYGVVDKQDFALIVPRHDDGRFQLVQQYRYPVQGRYWEFPQGAWEADGDADPRMLALSELAEETGYRSQKLVKLGHLFEAYGYANQGFYVFLATQLVPGQTSREDSEQDMQSRTFSSEEITGMIQSEAIKDAPTIAALSLLSLFDQC